MVVPKFPIPRDSTKAGSCFLHCFWIALDVLQGSLAVRFSIPSVCFLPASSFSLRTWRNAMLQLCHQHSSNRSRLAEHRQNQARSDAELYGASCLLQAAHVITCSTRVAQVRPIEQYANSIKFMQCLSSIEDINWTLMNRSVSDLFAEAVGSG